MNGHPCANDYRRYAVPDYIEPCPLWAVACTCLSPIRNFDHPLDDLDEQRGEDEKFWRDHSSGQALAIEIVPEYLSANLPSR